MPSGNYTYQLDTTGVLPANKVVGERHTLTYVNDRTYHFIVPIFAPFFVGSMNVTRVVGSNRFVLQENTDWLPALQFIGATTSIGIPIYGAISFTDLTLSGQIEIEYQTLGGEYTLDTAAMIETISNIVFNPRGSTWEEITNRPVMFRPIDHPWDFADLVGQTEVVQKLSDITDAIIAKQTSNANQVIPTKTQIGLGNVENYGPSGVLDAIQGLANDKIITPQILRAVLQNLGLLDLKSLIDTLRLHLNAKNNPHEVNKAHVDLHNVENLPVATPSDIVGKRSVKKYVTLDNLIDFMNLHGCKPSEDTEPSYPSKDSLLSRYCDGVKNMGVYADGNGGSYDKIIELNSKDCGYVPPAPLPAHPPHGTILNKYCIGYEQYGTYADGYGGSFTRLINFQSTECGYNGTPVPSGSNPPAGTILSTHCTGTTLVKVIANGQGGSYDENVPSSPQCQSSTPVNPPADLLLSTQCMGFDLRGTYTNGQGGTYTAIIQRNSPDCGYVAPTPAPTSPPPGPTPAPTPSNLPYGTLLDTYCSGSNLMGKYANGNGGVYVAVHTTNGCAGNTPSPTTSPPASYTPNIQISINGYTTSLAAAVGDSMTFVVNATGFPANVQVRYITEMTGAQNVTSSPSTVTMDAYGSYYKNTAGDLGVNISTRGIITYKITATYVAANGSTQVIESNRVNVDWKAPYTPVPAPQPPPSVPVPSTTPSTPPSGYPVYGTLLETYCVGYSLYGRYANGNGGTYDEIREVNSYNCGYTGQPSPGPTPPPPTLSPSPPPTNAASCIISADGDISPPQLQGNGTYLISGQFIYRPNSSFNVLEAISTTYNENRFANIMCQPGASETEINRLYVIGDGVTGLFGNFMTRYPSSAPQDKLINLVTCLLLNLNYYTSYSQTVGFVVSSVTMSSDKSGRFTAILTSSYGNEGNGG